MKCTPSACDEAPGMFAQLLTACSILLIGVTLPFSLFFVVKVVQEYERAVIFRLGRLLRGGAKGPGVFFVIPCLDVYEKIDMRTATYDVPPQEVSMTMTTEQRGLEQNWLPHSPKISYFQKQVHVFTGVAQVLLIQMSSR